MVRSRTPAATDNTVAASVASRHIIYNVIGASLW